MESVKYLLDENEIPKSWYNILEDLPVPLPPVIHPGTKQPIGPNDLAPLFPMDLILQEVSTEREIPIPEPVRDIYRLWRPTPLHRARRLERAPDTPAHIYYKYERTRPAGSHKPEDAATHDDTKYSLGSVLNHVLLHQTVIGLEARKQMELAGEYPDVVIGCIGGGSNMSGLTFPFLVDKFKGKKVRIVAAEPEACPSLTRGMYLYDFGDTAATTPLLKMYTLGHSFVPPAIHAGGLRYHGDAPLGCLLYHHKYIEAVAYQQRAVFEAAPQFARAEGIIPAPESAHAIRKATDEALQAKRDGSPRVILFNLSGHGHFDLKAYEDFLAGRLEDFAYPRQQVEQAVRELTGIQP